MFSDLISFFTTGAFLASALPSSAFCATNTRLGESHHRANRCGFVFGLAAAHVVGGVCGFGCHTRDLAARRRGRWRSGVTGNWLGARIGASGVAAAASGAAAAAGRHFYGAGLAQAGHRLLPWPWPRARPHEPALRPLGVLAIWRAVAPRLARLACSASSTTGGATWATGSATGRLAPPLPSRRTKVRFLHLDLNRPCRPMASAWRISEVERLST